MKVRNDRSVKLLVLVLFVACVAVLSNAQQANSVVPTLVNFSGTLMDANGKPLSGTVGVSFYLYKDEQGGSPLWMETQNVQPDKTGHYTVALGSSKNEGLPTSLFASGEARWLAVQAQGQAEQPRVLLLSVPYALKAGDAQTIGGLSPSAFVLAAPPTSSGNSSSGSNSNPNAPPLGGTGTTDYLPIWTNSTTLGSSVLFQSGTGTTAKVGIGTNKPASTLDVKGGSTIRGLFSLPTTGTATASKGFNSQAMDLAASAFNSGSKTAVTQTFQWQAQPVGNNTSSASGSLNLLFGQGTGKPSETGLNIASNGQITFAKGQTFPGTGDGTITGVTAGTDLTGGGTSGNVTLNVDTTKVVTGVTAGTDLTGGGTGGNLTLNVDTSKVVTSVKAGTDLTGGGVGGNLTLNLDITKVPQLSGGNTFTGNQTVTGNVSDTGNISATGSITGQTGVFSASNSTQVVNVTQSGAGSGVVTTSSNNTDIPAILANVNGATYGVAVSGQAAGVEALAVVGLATSTASGAEAVGVEGDSFAPNGAGVFGFSQDSTNAGVGVFANSASPYGVGSRAIWNGASTIGAGSGQAGVWGDSSGGRGVLGTSDNQAGVSGFSNDGSGVVGQASGSGSGVYGQSYTGAGVYGFSDDADGVYGTSISQFGNGINGVYYSNSVSGEGFASVGVWGDSGEPATLGVLGTTDDGNSLFGKNNTVNHETLYAENDSGFNNGTPYVARFAGPGSSTYCSIYRDSADNGTGDLDCTGLVGGAVPVGGSRMVNMYAVEAADNWFEDAGSGQLANGSATVALDQVFAQTVNGDVDYHVFLTPNGECEGLYVTNKTASGFEVRELHKGHSNIAFDYRIMARRKGFENVRMRDVTADFTRMKQESDELDSRIEAGKAAQKARPKPQHSPLPKKGQPMAQPNPRPIPPLLGAVGALGKPAALRNNPSVVHSE